MLVAAIVATGCPQSDPSPESEGKTEPKGTAKEGDFSSEDRARADRLAADGFRYGPTLMKAMVGHPGRAALLEAPNGQDRSLDALLVDCGTSGCSLLRLRFTPTEDTKILEPGEATPACDLRKGTCTGAETLTDLRRNLARPATRVHRRTGILNVDGKPVPDPLASLQRIVALRAAVKDADEPGAKGEAWLAVLRGLSNDMLSSARLPELLAALDQPGDPTLIQGSKRVAQLKLGELGLELTRKREGWVIERVVE